MKLPSSESSAHLRSTSFSFDALLPPEMARRAEEIGVAKSQMSLGRTFALSVLGGAFIALGAVFSTVATTHASDQFPYGVARTFGGVAFSLGLILVLVGGAELFTGNNLIVMAWASGRVTTSAILRNWLIVYVGNFSGAVAMAALIFFTGQHEFAGCHVGLSMLRIADAKCQLSPLAAVASGTACNILVCLAVWLCYSARTTADKVLTIVPPTSAFVAAGFEHCVANMYFVPAAILVRQWSSESFWQAIGKSAADFTHLHWLQFFSANLLPVTVGNLVGGALLVGLVYWSIFLRNATERGLEESGENKR